MNIGYLAMRAAPKVCRALRHKGVWYVTKQDMIDALKNHPRANDAIFWYCQAWHNGDDDLYRIMCSMDYTPRPWSPHPKLPDGSPNKNYDPDLTALMNRLATVFDKIAESPMQRIMLRDVREGHVLTHDGTFPCIAKGWPCKVFKHHGGLGVQCSGGIHGVRLLPGSEATFHPFTEDQQGYVVGFRR